MPIHSFATSADDPQESAATQADPASPPKSEATSVFVKYNLDIQKDSEYNMTTYASYYIPKAYNKDYLGLNKNPIALDALTMALYP